MRAIAGCPSNHAEVGQDQPNPAGDYGEAEQQIQNVAGARVSLDAGGKGHGLVSIRRSADSRYLFPSLTVSIPSTSDEAFDTTILCLVASSAGRCEGGWRLLQCRGIIKEDTAVRRLALVPFLAVLAGCGPTTIVLRDPTTGQMAQCHGDPWGWNPPGEAADCAKGYQAAGYVRVGP